MYYETNYYLYNTLITCYWTEDVANVLLRYHILSNEHEEMFSTCLSCLHGHCIIALLLWLEDKCINTEKHLGSMGYLIDVLYMRWYRLIRNKLNYMTRKQMR